MLEDGGVLSEIIWDTAHGFLRLAFRGTSMPKWIWKINLCGVVGILRRFYGGGGGLEWVGWRIEEWMEWMCWKKEREKERETAVDFETSAISMTTVNEEMKIRI